jgi:hypothetical protein
MHRLTPYALVALLLFGAGNNKLKRLSSAEQDHYQALKVWMDDKERKSYLKLKTEEERNAWLQEQKLWDRFYQYDKDDREAILSGDVIRGWTQDRVLMAFGAAHNRKRLTGRNASRSELFTYRFEVTADGEVLVWQPKSKETHNAQRLFRLELTLDDGVVAQIEKTNGWN